MASTFRPTCFKTDPKTGKRVKRKLCKGYVKYRTPDGIVHEVPGYTDREATRQLAARLERDSARRQEGIIDASAEHRKRPLAEHLEDFRKGLAAGGVSQKQVELTAGRARRVIDGCGFRSIADLSASRVQAFIAGMRASNRGNAPASIQTRNFYLAAVKQFVRWLVKDRRTADNPLAHLSGGNLKLDRRHDRRALDPDDFAAFINAARGSSAAAGIAYRDDDGLVFDFHALRHQFISNLALAGIHPRIAQTLARHSDIKLTLSRYSHVGLFDQTAAVEKLPPLPGTGPETVAATLRATGTEGEIACTVACTNG
jgi:integrase